MANAATKSIVNYDTFTVEDLLAHRKTIDDVLGKHRKELAGALANLEAALGERESGGRSPRSSRGTEVGNGRKPRAANKGKGKPSGGAGGIRWATKFNTFLANAIDRSGSGLTMADINAAAVKAKMMEEGKPNAYMAVRRLIAAKGLAKKGDKIVKGANFRVAE